MTSDEDDYVHKATLFGRDLGSIPCFRSSLLNGIGGGISTGLAYFFFTSKVKQACNVGVLSFGGITLSYWIYCRYQWSQRRFNMNMLKAAMKVQMANEGTERDSRITQVPKEELPFKDR